MDILEKLKNVKVMIFDVDGTLTDGRIILDKDGNELKSFYVRDGSRTSLALKADIKIFFISARISEAVKKRAENRQIQGVLSKRDFEKKPFADFFKELGVSKEEVLYTGDDVNDLSFMKECGVKVAVADASEEVKKIADITTLTKGGYGAVAEIIEKTLKAQGKFQELIEKHY